MTLTIGEMISDLDGLTIDDAGERDFVVVLLEQFIKELNEIAYEPGQDEDLAYEIERDLREFP